MFTNACALCVSWRKCWWGFWIPIKWMRIESVRQMYVQKEQGQRGPLEHRLTYAQGQTLHKNEKERSEEFSVPDNFCGTDFLLDWIKPLAIMRVYYSSTSVMKMPTFLTSLWRGWTILHLEMCDKEISRTIFPTAQLTSETQHCGLRVTLTLYLASIGRNITEDPEPESLDLQFDSATSWLCAHVFMSLDFSHL